MKHYSPMQTVTLNDGNQIPWLGLGVYQSRPGKETQEAVRMALDAGYRHIDTARVYGNERDVGEAIRASGIPRKDIFITTKLWSSDQGFDSAISGCEASLRDLGTDYVDLYLIHWPLLEKRKDSWKALERLKEEKRCRSIGVSNYLERHLTEIFEFSGVVPAVNQIEFSPFLYLKDLLAFCREKKIQLEAYSPLTQGRKLNTPTVVAIAKAHAKTPAQVLLRWAIQHEVVVIPKSVRKERIVENQQIFDFSLSAAEMHSLDGLHDNFRTCWDPTKVP